MYHILDGIFAVEGGVAVVSVVELKLGEGSRLALKSARDHNFWNIMPRHFSRPY